MLKKLLPVFIFGISIFTNTFGQKNISLLGNLKFPGTTLAGVWHYVDNNAHEYALVGTGNGLSIVDVNTPANPVLLFDIPAVSSLWREVKTYSHYAYVTTEGGGGITIVDMDSLPVAVNYKTYTGDGPIAGLLGRSHSLQIDNGFLYINGPTGIANGGVIICSLADPWNPVYVGEENAQYCHDCYIRNDTMWASEIYAGQFSVYDITNKATPVLLATQATPGAFNHNAWLSDNGKYIFTTDEHPNSPVGVFDVSDLTNIKPVDLYYTNLNPTAEVHNVRVINDYLVNPAYGNSGYGSQLTICDASRPQNIIETGNFPLGGPTTGLSLSWDASPYLPSGNILATDVDSGLFILAPTYIRGCYLEGVVTDSITGALLNNVVVELLSTAITDTTILSGEYKTGLADPGTISVKFTKPGYQSKTINNVTLTNGVLTTLNVQLWDGTVGIETVNGTSDLISVSPNPFSEFTTLHIPPVYFKDGGTVSVSLSDVTGRLIKTYESRQQRDITINNSGMTKGIYFYSVKKNKVEINHGKLVLE